MQQGTLVTYDQWMALCACAYLRAILAASQTVTQAARRSGKHRTYFYDLLRRYDIHPMRRQLNFGNQAWQELQ